MWSAFLFDYVVQFLSYVCTRRWGSSSGASASLVLSARRLTVMRSGGRRLLLHPGCLFYSFIIFWSSVPLCLFSYLSPCHSLVQVYTVIILRLSFVFTLSHSIYFLFFLVFPFFSFANIYVFILTFAPPFVNYFFLLLPPKFQVYFSYSFYGPYLYFLLCPLYIFSSLLFVLGSSSLFIISRTYHSFLPYASYY